MQLQSYAEKLADSLLKYEQCIEECEEVYKKAVRDLK